MSIWERVPAFAGDYNFGRTIGKGSFSLVKEARDVKSQRRFAIKIVPIAAIAKKEAQERFETEVRLICRMNHPGVIRIHDFIRDSDYFYLVMDLCSGGNLLSQVSVSRPSEAMSKPIFKQVVSAIAYIHEQGVAHRDIKLDNILLDDRGHAKIIDFGFSKIANQLCVTPCGSPAYAAPEVISGSMYDGKMSDMWSCGVVLFGMVTGELPWKGTNAAQVFNQIMRSKFEIPEYVSVTCRDLIQRLLVIEPKNRLAAKEVLRHPWLEGVENDCDDEIPISSNSLDDFSDVFRHSGEASPRSQLDQIGERMVKKCRSRPERENSALVSRTLSANQLTMNEISVRARICCDIRSRSATITPLNQISNLASFK